MKRDRKHGKTVCYLKTLNSKEKEKRWEVAGGSMASRLQPLLTWRTPGHKFVAGEKGAREEGAFEN